MDLVNQSMYLTIQNQRHQKKFNLTVKDIELSCQKLDLHTSIRFDQLQQDLCPDVSEQIFDVITNKRIVHNSPPIVFQNLFKLKNFILLVGRDKVGHGNNFCIVFVRLCLLGVEDVDLGLFQHVGQ
eukprot:Lithocolla_globosa_v1_NODE_4613_length_1400_cov_16.863941.p2 type:complete len:126 gc:universal NODE_4613_length_1400_cov_16.863941:145-522(+)